MSLSCLTQVKPAYRQAKPASRRQSSVYRYFWIPAFRRNDK
ncbi:hypothetical protein MCHI_001638 [Candidatus Magnetoovum chiemensis]|nr:hypothetical protein MCHI_001638 [Candidatus Magnetoovum chiemensis]